MRKIWLVVKREYLTRVRTKAFLLSTLALPLFSGGVFILMLTLASRKADRPVRFSILDGLGGLGPQIQQQLKEKLPDGRPRFEMVRALNFPAEAISARDELAAEVRQGKLDGFLEVPRGILDGKEAILHTLNANDFQTSRSLAVALNRAVIARRLSDRGVNVSDLAGVLRPVDVSLVKVTGTGESRESGESFVLQLAIVMILYITLLIYGVMTMRSVLQEKTTRIVEILASSIKPVHLLAGKILGVAGVGLTQYLIWTGTGALFSAYGAAARSSMLGGAAVPRLHLPVSYLVYPVVFFLAGYFLYAALYAAIGAMVSSEEDLQHVQLPVTMILVACMVLFPVIERAPNSHLALALSLFPFTSPILMVFRITVQTPPFWQIALALVLCVGTTVGVIQISAKIYRVGILMYGKRPSLVEVLRWLKYT